MSFGVFRGGAKMTSLLKFGVLASLLTSRVSCPSPWARQNFPAPLKICLIGQKLQYQPQSVRRWSGLSMALGNIQSNLDNSRARADCVCSRYGLELLDFFSLAYNFSFLFPFEALEVAVLCFPNPSNNSYNIQQCSLKCCQVFTLEY